MRTCPGIRPIRNGTGVPGLDRGRWSGIRRMTAQSIVQGEDAYASAVLADAPLAYWKLAEASPSGAGSVASSASGGTYPGTPNGTITWGQNGAMKGGGTSALFNGSSGYVTAGTTLATALMGSATWTVEAWFCAHASASGYIFSAASDTNHRVGIQYYSGRIYTTSNAGGNKSTTMTVVGSWHHLVLDSTGALYIDGNAASGTSSAATNATAGVFIGALQNASNFFNGRIANVAVYNTVIGPTRVAAHFSAAHGPLPAGLVFSNTLQTDTPEVLTPGSHDRGVKDNGSTFVNDGAANVLEVGGGTFRSLTYDNSTNYDMFAKVGEGTIEIDFKYSGILGTWLLMQITGKDRGGVYDTNDSLKLSVTPTGLFAQYHYNNGGTITSVSVASTLTAGTWYTARLRWNTSGATTMSVEVNGASNSTVNAIGATNCLAWHHLLIGNDTNTTPTSLRLRNMRTYGSWQN